MAAAITASMTNVAVSRSIRDLRLLGDDHARPIPTEEAPDETSGPKSNKLGIRVKGETKWYWVVDRMLVDSLTMSNGISAPFLELQATPARVLRELITKDPSFMLAAMLRDTFSSWGTSGLDVIPIVGTVDGYVEALRGSVIEESLRGAGVSGGYEFKGDMDNMAKGLKRHLKQQKEFHLHDVPLHPVESVGRLWRFWDRVSAASDTAQRVAAYKAVAKAGLPEAQAVLEALLVINFSARGGNSLARYLGAVVTFMNARVQGLDVLHRGAKGEISSWNQKQRQKNFYWRASAIVFGTMLYYLAHSKSDEDDDPWYHNAPEYIKDNYWIIPPTWFGLPDHYPALRIPIPFEVGLLFKVIPERIMRLLDNSSDGKETWEAILRHGGTTLNFNPTPQWLAPVLEVVANYDFYRGAPIVSHWDGKSEGWLADPEWVSPFAIMLSKEIDRMGGRLSAEKVDHLVRGYVGTLGSYVIMATDSVGRNIAGMPQRSARRLDQQPILSRFLQQHQGTDQLQVFYDLWDQLDRLTTSLNDARAIGDVAGEAYLAKSRENLLFREARIREMKSQLVQIRASQRQVKNDRSSSPDEKRRILNELDELSNDVLRGVRELRIEALGRSPSPRLRPPRVSSQYQTSIP